jgi:hypothetical protein
MTENGEEKVAKKKKIDREGGNKKDEEKTQIRKPKGVVGQTGDAGEPAS